MSTHFSANQYEQAFAAKRLQNWEIPKQFKEVSLVFCFIKWQHTSEAYSFPLKSCVPCTVTLEARSGQSKCIMEENENSCESRQTSKEKTFWLRFMLEGSRPCLHRTHVGWITLPFPFYWSELWPGILGIRIVWYVINTRFHQLFGRRLFSVTEYHMN